MELQQFEMMDGVMASNKYIVVAKSNQTSVGIRAYVGPAPNIEHECISAGFKLRIEGTPVMIPSYKGNGGDHRSTFFVKPIMQLPAMGHWVLPVVEAELASWVDELMEQLAAKGLEPTATNRLITDYILECFKNDHPEPVAKYLKDGKLAFQSYSEADNLE